MKKNDIKSNAELKIQFLNKKGFLYYFAFYIWYFSEDVLANIILLVLDIWWKLLSVE